VLIVASVPSRPSALRLPGASFGVDIAPRSAVQTPEASGSMAPPGLPFLYRASLNKWWFDELIHLLFIVIGGASAAFLVVRPVSSTAPSRIGGLTVGPAELRQVQTGRVQNYALGSPSG
jgi:hypothetical protein